ncbi:TPA: NB-ARC domain-containing protein [Photobacterium damselae]
MQPPRLSKLFVGRDAVLSELIDSLDKSSTIQVCGLGGIGKSELLLQALKQSNSVRNVIWCNIEKYLSINELLLALLSVFSDVEENCDVEKLPTYFDKYNSCIVFDGIEQSNLNQLEDLEDIIKQWYLETNKAQFIMTTQVELYGVACEQTIKLTGLRPHDSRYLFEHAYGPKLLASDKGIDELMKFCDGHALAIIFASALTKYYGCATKVMTVISSHQPLSLGLPERFNHNRHTSLELCLKTAYNALSFESKKLLWALSESPAGVNTNYLDDEWVEIVDVGTVYGSLKRWNFVDDIEVTEGVYRTNVLTPIRKFVISTAKSENSEAYEKIIALLARECTILVALLEHHYSCPEKIPLLINRYEIELPNILNIIKLAHSRENNKELNDIAGKLASAVMQYYFVIGAPKVGTRILKSSAELALKRGDVKNANNLLQQFISLLHRGSECNLDALELFERVEVAAKELDLSPELSMTKALRESHESNDLAVEKYAKEGIEGFKYRLENSMDEIEYESICYNLSTLFGLLGTSLLNQRKPSLALDAYYSSLEYQTESSSGVNIGQTYHQIGKCESKLGNHESAVKHFSMSLNMFIHVGMTDYISHSSGELGHSLIELDSPNLGSVLLEGSMFEVLLDLKQYTLKTFDISFPLDFQGCRYNIRKLIGTFFLCSFIDQAYKIEPFVEELKKEIHDKLSSHESSILLSSAQVIIPLDVLHTTLELGCFISRIESAIGTDAEYEVISGLNNYLSDFDYFIDAEVSLEGALLVIDDWLSVYLKSKNVEFSY